MDSQSHQNDLDARLLENPSVRFYVAHYDIIGNWRVRPGNRVMLGGKAKEDRRCRFCGGHTPHATFRDVAHAIPESLGNKSIFSNYECDACNSLFGNGIEHDLGNWSKPTRTFSRIRGKKGVPTLKKDSPGSSWRIEYDSDGFNIKASEHDPFYQVDEAN